MRARNIKPGFFLNETLGTADPYLALLFAGLWCMADREGRLEDRPRRIKAEIFPYRETVDVQDINGYLTAMSRMELVIRYAVGEKHYIEIVNFKKHQNPHHTEKKSLIPPSCQGTVDSPLSPGEYPADSLIPDSLIPDSLIPDSKPLCPSADEQGVENAEPEFILTKKKRKLTGKRLATFKAFWAAFNYKASRAEAADAWMDVPMMTDTLIAEIVAAASREASRRPSLLAQGKTPKMAQGWIAGRRWEDENQAQVVTLSAPMSKAQQRTEANKENARQAAERIFNGKN